MVTFRRKFVAVPSDRRRHTRIEFHFPVVILGVDDQAQILDFSLDGFYIELRSGKQLNIGQLINLALRLPIEREPLRLKAKIVYKDSQGIGCRFMDLTPPVFERLERCFNVFTATLPVD
jgi:hypothetical protein